MKFNKILLFFSIALPASILLRILQLYYTIDPITGFFNNEYKNIGVYLLLLIIGICIAMAILCFNGHRNPEKPSRTGALTSISSVLLSLGIAAQLFTNITSGIYVKWQLLLMIISGVASSVYFFFFGIKRITKRRLPAPTSVIPPIYFIVKIICIFTSISSLALISDNIIILSAYCLACLFFLSFGKLYNGIDKEYNFRRLSATALVTAIICFTQSVPYFMVNLIWGYVYTHTTFSANVELFALGLFITLFTLFHFSKKNVK